MNRKNAIKKIESHLEEYETKKHVQIWMQESRSLIGQFLSEDSNEYKRLAEIKVEEWQFDTQKYLQGKNLAFGILKSSKEKIKSNGLYRPKKENVLIGTSNLKIIIFAITIFIAGVTAGIWITSTPESRFFSVFNPEINEGDNHDNYQE